MIGAALAAFSCSKEINDPDETFAQTGKDAVAEEVTFTLSVPESEDTKTTLGSKTGTSYPVLWSSGDVITLNGTAATSFTPESGNASAKATFKLANLSAPYNFLYGGVSGQSAQVTFPATQNYVAGGFDPAALPMYASLASRSDNVVFSHLAALLKFSITGSKKIDSVSLAAADENQSLSGNFTIGTTSGLLDGSLTPVATGAGLIYGFGGHIQLSTTPFEFFIAVPAGTYEGGITLTIVDNDSGSMAVKVLDTDATKTIAAGKVREFNTIEYVPEKEKNLIQIYDATTLNKFRTRVANGETTLNARVTCNAANFSASSIAGEWVPIEDYKGIFEGNGKGITGLTKPLFGTLKGVVKNLTLNSTINATAADDLHWGMFAKQIIPSSEVDDIAGLQNCTAEGSITWTPASAIGSYMTLGGLVGNNKGGTISGCTNNAAVTFDDGGVTHTNQPSVGGVIGRTQKGGDLASQGDISNCTNNGTVVCAAQFSQGAYIGGVLGYQVEKKETMSGCVNHGLVKVTSSFSTSGALHLAGVAGMAKGTLENCTNASDGVVTSEACSVGSYLCQGGVVGRLNGTATYETLTNAGTLNVSALGGPSGRLIGGVVGRCQEGATLNGVTNSGNINYTAEVTNETHIGGVVADNVQDGIILENCSSTGGTLTFSSASHSGGIYVGGVVGYSTKDVTSCSSAMTITTTGSMSMGSNSYICFGGVIGYLTGAVTATNCTNSGAINYGQVVTDNGQTYVGGLVGALTKGEVSGGGNSGALTFTGQNKNASPSVGGIVGRVFSNDSGDALSNNVTNSGAIVLNSSTSSGQFFYLGGLVGQHLAGNISGTNNAPITVTELHCGMMSLGGIVGYLAGGNVSNGTNTANGDIALGGFISNYHSYTGGIVGIASGDSSIAAGGGTITGASNAGDVTVGSGCAIPRNNYVGGVIAYAGNTVSGASNTGNIVNNYSQGSSSNATSYHYAIGGVAGYSVAALSSCYNTGDVTNNGSTYTSEINVAGVVGISEGDITSCSNGTPSLPGGTITNTATSGTNTIQDAQIGGVVGNTKDPGYTLTSCFNKGNVVNSGAANSISVGGIAAWSTKGTFVTCYNEGDVENSGIGSNTSATAPGARVAGLIASASGANTISGDADNYNYNNGEVYEHSASARAAVGGVCAWANNASTSLNYAQNLSGGVIRVEDGEYTNVYVGGVLGVETAAASFNYTKNAGKIGIRNITISKAAYIGGVHGGFTANGAQTITGCENTGAIDCPDSGGKSENMKSTSSASVVTYIGGISSGAGNNAARTSKTFNNCINRGAITMYNQCWTRLGGVVGYANQNPSGCENHGKIVYYRKAGGYNSSNGAVGGVVGYINIATVSNLTNTGGVQSTGSAPNCYTGGIVGSGGANMNTMTNCNVGKSGINIVGSGNAEQVAGLFASSESGSKDWTFTGCQVMSGTKCRGTVVTDANMETYVIGRGAVPSSITNPPTVVTSF